MKKLFSLLGICLYGFIMSLFIPSDFAEALAPPETKPEYYSGSFNSSEEFIQWFKSEEAKTQNNGAYANLIDKNTNYGYLLVPYVEGGAVKPSVNYDSDANFEYRFTSPQYKLETRPLYTVEDKKYAHSGIGRYIKDNLGVSDFGIECVVEKNEPGMPIYKYLFNERVANVGGSDIKCVVGRTTVYSPYGDKSLVISDSYSINFIYDGMKLSIVYEDACEENNIIESLRYIKFYEEILNQANYDRTKREIMDLKPEEKAEDSQETKTPEVIKKDSNEPVALSGTKADKKSEKPDIKIVGKKIVKCGKSYKYIVKANGLSGKVKWSVNNKNRAKIFKSGKFKALKKGAVKLTVKINKCKSSIRINIV